MKRLDRATTRQGGRLLIPGDAGCGRPLLDARRLGALGASVFGRGTAFLLLAGASPLLVLLGVLVLVTSGRPVLYRGRRMGRGKRPFTILKFRSLVRDAEKIVGGGLLKHGQRLTTPLGDFLRATRLDELPQLWNVVRGDMSFIGPRPEREAVYEAQCQAIPDYDERFRVRPGLIGHSQLFTPHGTPKRFRTLLDNQRLREPYSAAERCGLVGFTALATVASAGARSAKSASKLVATRVRRRYVESRAVLRRRPVAVEVSWEGVDGRSERARLVDIGGRHLAMSGESAPGHEPFALRIEIPVRRRKRRCLRVAQCEGSLVATRLRDGSRVVVVKFSPRGAASAYVISQYLLRESFVAPFRPGAGRLRRSTRAAECARAELRGPEPRGPEPRGPESRDPAVRTARGS